MATVQEQIDQALQYADDQLSNGTEYINAIAQVADYSADVDLSDPPYIFTGTYTPEVASLLRSGQPLLDITALTKPLDPGAFVQGTQISQVDTTVPTPEFTDSAPDLAFPDRPDISTLPDAPLNNLGAFESPNLPERPVLTLPDEFPSLATVVIPETLTLEVPTLELNEVDDELLVPSNVFQFSEIEYQSDVLDELKALLLSDLQNGGYGINTEDEQRLWDSARDRAAQAMLASREELDRVFSSRGLTMPSGAHAKALRDSGFKYAEEINQANRDISHKRADMYVEARKFAVEKGLNLEDLLIRNHGFMMERALNAARITVEMGIEVFNASVRRVQAQVEAYRARVSKYQALLGSLETRAAVYRTEVDAARLVGETNRIAVENYTALHRAAEVVVGLYRTEMEAARVNVDIQKTALQAFQTEVEAYSAQVRAKAVEFGIYEAGIKGEQAKLGVYETQARVYTQQVAAFAEKRRTEIAVIDNQVRQASLELDAYRTESQKYQSDFENALKEVQLSISENEVQQESWSRLIKAWNDLSDVEARKDGIVTDGLLARYNLLKERAALELQATLKSADLRLNAAKSGADIYSSIASGALGMLNAVTTRAE